MTDQQSSSSETRPPWRVLAAIAALVAISLGCYLYWYRQHHNPAVPVIDCDRLRQLRNLGLSHLENENFADAESAFQEIVELFPQDTFGYRNLAVCRLLALESNKTGGEAAARAIDDLIGNEIEPSVGHILAGRLHLLLMEGSADIEQRERQSQKAVAAFRQAAKMAPEDVSIPYAIFEATRYSADADVRAESSRMLADAYEKQPHNLFLLVDFLLEQGERKDPAIANTIDAAREILAPLQRGIQMRANVDVLEYLDRARNAAGNDQWNVVLASLRNINQPIRSEEYAQSDKRKLKPHLLEYVLTDYDPEFSEQYCPVQVEAPLPWQVSFESLEQPRVLRELPDIRQIALADFDLDGSLDILVLQDSRFSAFTRNGEPLNWTLAATIGLPSGMRGMVAADLDRDDKRASGESLQPERGGTTGPACQDADLDIVAFGSVGIVVLRNDLSAQEGQRVLEKIDQETEFQAVQDVFAATLVDYEHDGDLDIVASSAQGISQWYNIGKMKFANGSAWSSLPPDGMTFASMFVADWDRDVDLDIVMAGDRDGSVGYLENLRHGQFRWRSFQNAMVDAPDAASAIAVVEADGNASWDLLSSGPAGTQCLLTRTVPAQSVTGMRTERASLFSADKLLVADFDNDGHGDTLAWRGDAIQMYRGLPSGQFESIPDAPAEFPRSITGVDRGDLDGDGDLDLAIANEQGVLLFSNNGGNKNHWLDVRLQGKEDSKSGRVNQLGIGSLLELKYGAGYQARVVDRQTTHFGLGTIRFADALRVVMTNGVPQSVAKPTVDQTICEEMSLKGSCPYVYTWTGQRFEFFTDLLWASPIGLQFDEGVLAPARSWEYLRIPGDRLQASEGRYRLQITEELWEAGYFDLVELIAVDHPTDVEVFSNEKVGPAEIAEYKVHTVRERRYPVAASDKFGRDVLSAISKRDNRFFKGFEQRHCQGLVEEHFLELDLGTIRKDTPVMLFLTGWIYPTDTSLNIAIGQNPALSGPNPPAIHVPDGDGGWREAVPFMGFPGGKTKTIAVALSEVLRDGDGRLRIVTSNEIYWDEVFFTTGEQQAEMVVASLPLVSADLHYRGFSRATPRDSDRQPETYDYELASAQAKWPPMLGRFTRYGDVKDLLVDADDRLVVLGAGDEMTLEFDVSRQPRDGWTRDFLLHNIGWDKDADLNTVYGQNVDPLPLQAMDRYPYPIDIVPDGDRYADYLRRYQTRRQPSMRFWKFSERR